MVFMGSRFPRYFWPSKKAFFPRIAGTKLYKNATVRGAAPFLFPGRCDRFPRTTLPMLRSLWETTDRSVGRVAAAGAL